MSVRVLTNRAAGIGLALVAGLAAAGCSPPDDDAAASPPTEATTQPTARSAGLVRLIDGDSAWFEIDGREVEVRLLDYNAPELFEGDGGPPSCNGAAARDALAELLAGASVIEVAGEETDRYGRLLVDLTVDGESVIDLLVADGHGLWIGDDDPGGLSLMRVAAGERLGMWGDGCGTPAAAGLEVGAVEPDPPGRDEDDLNGEYVELLNRGPAPIDLTGWDIRDQSSSNRFDLDEVGVIGPGDRLVVRTGSGRSGGGELFLGSPSPVWSNRSETVLVIDPDGVVAAWAFAFAG